MSTNIYSTAQAAELLGISASTIHTWKRRNLGKLLEGQHWVKQNDTLLWTELGIQALSVLKEGNECEPHSEVNEPDIQALSTLESRYLPLLDMLANAIAPRLQQHLDQKVMGKVKGFATNAQPMTSVECVELLTQLGLKPANPAELLAGQDIQALPSSNQ
jgi:hypothetical protein